MDRICVLLVLLVLLVAACGGSGVVTTTSTVSGPATTPTSSSGTATTTSAMTSTTPVTVPATTVPPEHPPLLLSGDGGVVLESDAAGVAVFTARPALLALPDLRGGVLFQGTPADGPIDQTWDKALGRYRFVWPEGTGPDPILRIVAPGLEPEVVVAHGDGLLSMVDVTMIDGAPCLLYRLLVPGSDISQREFSVIEHLHLLNLDTGEDRVLGIIGSFESSLIQLDVAGEVTALGFTGYGEGRGLVGVFATSDLLANPEDEWVIAPCGGFELDCAGYGPSADCAGEDGCTGNARVALSRDATSLAWVGAKQVGPTQVVAVDLASGEEMWRGLLPAGDQVYFDRVDYDGEWAVVSSGDSHLVHLIASGEVTATLVGWTAAVLW